MNPLRQVILSSVDRLPGFDQTVWDLLIENDIGTRVGAEYQGWSTDILYACQGGRVVAVNSGHMRGPPIREAKAKDGIHTFFSQKVNGTWVYINIWYHKGTQKVCVYSPNQGGGDLSFKEDDALFSGFRRKANPETLIRDLNRILKSLYIEREDIAKAIEAQKYFHSLAHTWWVNDSPSLYDDLTDTLNITLDQARAMSWEDIYDKYVDTDDFEFWRDEWDRLLGAQQ